MSVTLVKAAVLPQIKTLDEAISLAEQAGSQTAGGLDSIMALAKVAFRATRAGVVDKDNVEDLYKAYLSKANAAEFAGKTADADAIKFGVSKLRVFVRLAHHKGSSSDVWKGVVVNTRDYLRRKGEAGKAVGSIYEQVLKAARYALSDKMPKDRAPVLKDEHLAEAFAKAEKQVEPVGDTLASVIRTLEQALNSREFPVPIDQTDYLARVLGEAIDQFDAFKAKGYDLSKRTAKWAADRAAPPTDEDGEGVEADEDDVDADDIDEAA